MKKIFAIPAILVLFSCNSQKPNGTLASITSEDCPADGKCTVSVEEGKSMDITTDALGKLYYKLVDAPGKNVVTYEYTRDVDTTLADAGYREQIVFEIDTENPNTDLTGFTLENGKVLFGRFCFCRGATGYYRVRDGYLSVQQADDIINVKMNFKITEVPQVINQFEFAIE